MDLKNLGIVFGPTLLRPQKETLEKMMTDTSAVNGFVAFCCERHSDLFTATSSKEGDSSATASPDKTSEEAKEDLTTSATADGSDRKKKVRTAKTLAQGTHLTWLF